MNPAVRPVKFRFISVSVDLKGMAVFISRLQNKFEHRFSINFNFIREAFSFP